MGMWDAALGSATGGVLEFLGRSSAESHAEQNAREQMGFQREMSSTAYQRAVTDMKAAGLNPMLAYSQGGASTPAGSQAPTAKLDVGSIVSSAVAGADIAKKVAETKTEENRPANVDADTRAKNAQAADVEYAVKELRPLQRQLAEFMNTAGHLSQIEANQKINALLRTVAVEGGGSGSMGEVMLVKEFRARMDAAGLTSKLVDPTFRKALAEAYLLEMQKAGAKNESDYQKSFWGGRYERYLPNVPSVRFGH